MAAFELFLGKNKPIEVFGCLLKMGIVLRFTFVIYLTSIDFFFLKR